MHCSLLVVVDTSQLIVTMSEAPEVNSCSVTEVTNGGAVSYTLEEKPYQLVVADLKIPQVNGCTILQKAQSSTPDISVVFSADSYDSNPSIYSYLYDADKHHLTRGEQGASFVLMTEMLQRLVPYRKNSGMVEQLHSIIDNIRTVVMLVSNDIRRWLVPVNRVYKTDGALSSGMSTLSVG